MVKSDMLYQLDMRLREVTQKPDKIFGGVAIFDFGDILQLRPCRAKYIFEEPVCQDYKIAFHSGTHWNAFPVINLEENHRQNEDKDYADLLNRVLSRATNSRRYQTIRIKNSTTWPSRSKRSHVFKLHKC